MKDVIIRGERWGMPKDGGGMQFRCFLHIYEIFIKRKQKNAIFYRKFTIYSPILIDDGFLKPNQFQYVHLNPRIRLSVCLYVLCLVLAHVMLVFVIVSASITALANFAVLAMHIWYMIYPMLYILHIYVYIHNYMPCTMSLVCLVFFGQIVEQTFVLAFAWNVYDWDEDGCLDRVADSLRWPSLKERRSQQKRIPGNISVAKQKHSLKLKRPVLFQDVFGWDFLLEVYYRTNDITKNIYPNFISYLALQQINLSCKCWNWI